MTKYIFITGGVVSSLGKGIAAASLATILESRGLSISILKLDPYLNVDPGTMSPYQHGEVYVTADGAETDLDLGHYERFIARKMTRNNSVTAGQIYDQIIAKERRGEFLGATVQVIPHVTEQIKQSIKKCGQDLDILIVEIGGTVGDIESLPFLEAIRQMRAELGRDNSIFIHLTLVPYIATAGEVKTKPTQHSVKELRSIGIQADILLCRTQQKLDDNERRKIALFTNVEMQAVISCEDVRSIYSIPLMLHAQNVDEIVLRYLNIQAKPAQLQDWREIINIQENANNTVKIAIVGKYVSLADAYKSVNEALIHAGIINKITVKIEYIDAQQLEVDGADVLANYDGVLVPGGFGERGIEGKILAANYARKNQIPYFGICLGMQIAVIEAARDLLNYIDANSTEFAYDTGHPVIALVTEWVDASGAMQIRDEKSNKGGTMRLGAQTCRLTLGSRVQKLYAADTATERHRHRYEVNPRYIDELELVGLRISGRDLHSGLVEIVELEGHPWYIGCQFHPEFSSRPQTGQPLFNGFVAAALGYKDQKAGLNYSQKLAVEQINE